MTRDQDFTPTGLKLTGAWENDRNSENAPLFKAIIRECFHVQDVICGHHLVYVARDPRPDGFTYEIIEEIPSADALIFDHAVARKLWGEAHYLNALARLAMEPVETRDILLGDMLDKRHTWDDMPASEHNDAAGFAARVPV